MDDLYYKGLNDAVEKYPTITLGFTEEQQRRMMESRLGLIDELAKFKASMGATYDHIYKDIEDGLYPQWQGCKFEVRIWGVWIVACRYEAEGHYNKGRKVRLTVLNRGRFIIKKKNTLPYWDNAPPMPTGKWCIGNTNETSTIY